MLLLQLTKPKTLQSTTVSDSQCILISQLLLHHYKLFWYVCQLPEVQAYAKFLPLWLLLIQMKTSRNDWRHDRNLRYYIFPYFDTWNTKVSTRVYFPLSVLESTPIFFWYISDITYCIIYGSSREYHQRGYSSCNNNKM